MGPASPRRARRTVRQRTDQIGRLAQWVYRKSALIGVIKPGWFMSLLVTRVTTMSHTKEQVRWDLQPAHMVNDLGHAVLCRHSIEGSGTGNTRWHCIRREGEKSERVSHSVPGTSIVKSQHAEQVRRDDKPYSHRFYQHR